MSQEELLVAFPAKTPSAVPMATQFRSTWLWSSLRALKTRELLDAYMKHLPLAHHEAVLSNVAGMWLPIEVALAHYRACDALQLPQADIVAIGREVTSQVHGTLLARFVRLATGAGVTPWTVLERLQVLWQRVWTGSGVAVIKLGPKEARVEIAGWPCAESLYCRVAIRGAIPAVTDLFCSRSYARELHSRATPTSLAYVVSWA
jgi:hypothetical protein